MIAYSIYIAKKSTNINNIYVSTDSQEIAEVAKFFGAQVPFLRPSYLATDKASDKNVFLHFYNEFKKLDIPISKEVVHLRPTTPGREVDVVDNAIKEFHLDEKCTSMRSGSSLSDLHPHKWFNLERGYFKPLIRSISDIEITNLPRQSFPEVYIPNGYIDVVRYSIFKLEGKFHGNNIKSYITKKVIDIDNFSDLNSANKDHQILKLSEVIKKDYKF